MRFIKLDVLHLLFSLQYWSIFSVMRHVCQHALSLEKRKRGSHLERTWLINWSPDDKRKSSNIAGHHFRTWFNFSTWSTSKCNQVKISVHNMHAKSWAIISSDYNTIEPFRLPEYITISEMSKNFFLFILWTLWEVLDPLVTKI